MSETPETTVVGDKHTFVGQFFENVAHKVFGGDLSRDENGDICLWRTETTVEVKSSGLQSSYGFRLAVEQIEHYERVSVFPFSRSWYALFAYRNRRMRGDDGKQHTELSYHTSPRDINRYLANAVEWGLLVDLSIVSRWKEIMPRSTKSILGHPGAETIDLKCRDAHGFVNGGLVEGLEELDLNPANYGVLHGRIKAHLRLDLFCEEFVSFPLTAILPSGELSRVQRMLYRRGFRTRKELL